MIGQPVKISRWKKKAGFAIDYHFRISAHRSRDRREATGHRLQQRIGNPLDHRGQHINIHRGEKLGHAMAQTQERDAIFPRGMRLDELLQLAALSAFSAACAGGVGFGFAGPPGVLVTWAASGAPEGVTPPTLIIWPHDRQRTFLPANASPSC